MHVLISGVAGDEADRRQAWGVQVLEGQRNHQVCFYHMSYFWHFLSFKFSFGTKLDFYYLEYDDPNDGAPNGAPIESLRSQF